MGRLQEGDAGPGSGLVLPHRAGDLLRDGAAVVARGPGVAAHEAPAGPAPGARAHLVRQPALPRRRSEPDQAGASVQV